mmetsp:Transcript_25955/g.83331  ORF Transcript_25955/g.83331 Transcript_25955/m.83331 type:complete len:418 (+) Transcript_25955:291-1544(+)
MSEDKWRLACALGVGQVELCDLLTLPHAGIADEEAQVEERLCGVCGVAAIHRRSRAARGGRRGHRLPRVSEVCVREAVPKREGDRLAVQPAPRHREPLSVVAGEARTRRRRVRLRHRESDRQPPGGVDVADEDVSERRARCLAAEEENERRVGVLRPARQDRAGREGHDDERRQPHVRRRVDGARRARPRDELLQKVVLIEPERGAVARLLRHPAPARDGHVEAAHSCLCVRGAVHRVERHVVPGSLQTGQEARIARKEDSSRPADRVVVPGCPVFAGGPTLPRRRSRAGGAEQRDPQPPRGGVALQREDALVLEENHGGRGRAARERAVLGRGGDAVHHERAAVTPHVARHRIVRVGSEGAVNDPLRHLANEAVRPAVALAARPSEPREVEPAVVAGHVLVDASPRRGGGMHCPPI